jgi:iron(III) transport system ATP-binding protein
MSTLVIEGVAKSYGLTPVLNDVALTVPAATFAAVLGPSGSGKTTLLRLIAGFDPPGAGRIALNGTTLDDDSHHVPAHRRRIGYVPQDGLLFPHLSVAENIGFGLPRRERRGARVAELLDLTGLGGLGDRRPHELSGGQQQRVAVARALAPNPKLLLLDEPFAALDANLRTSLRADIKELLEALGTTTVLVTHDQEEALSLAQSVAVLDGGRIIQHASPRAIYESPESLAVARFLGDPNLLPAVIRGTLATTALGQLAVEPGNGATPSDAVLLIRPEQILVSPLATPPAPHLTARVLSVTYFGHDAVTRLLVDSPDGGIELTSRTRGDLAPAVHERVGVSFDGPMRAHAPVD